MLGLTSIDYDETISDLKEQFHDESTWVSVAVVSLMGTSVQIPGTSLDRIDVDQICCDLDDVFMNALIERWKTKRRNTYRNSSRLIKIHDSRVFKRNSFIDLLFGDG